MPTPPVTMPMPNNTALVKQARRSPARAGSYVLVFLLCNWQIRVGVREQGSADRAKTHARPSPQSK